MAKKKTFEVELLRTTHERTLIRISADSKGAAIFEATQKAANADWAKVDARTEVGKVEALASGETVAAAETSDGG